MKNVKQIVGLILILLSGFSSFSQKFSANDIVGKWYTEENKSVISVYLSGNGTYYGMIESLKDPVYPADDKEAGKKKHDRNNPDKAKQATSLIGLLILKGFTFDGKENWKNGTIYDPENGKTYDCTIWLSIDKNILHVRGYVGVSLIGRTTDWTKKK